MEPRKQSFEARPPKLFETRPSRPEWWADPRASGWDQAKEAFRSDWEETRSHFAPKSQSDLPGEDVGVQFGPQQSLEPIVAMEETTPSPSSTDDELGTFNGPIQAREPDQDGCCLLYTSRCV